MAAPRIILLRWMRLGESRCVVFVSERKSLSGCAVAAAAAGEENKVFLGDDTLLMRRMLKEQLRQSWQKLTTGGDEIILMWMRTR